MKFKQYKSNGSADMIFSWKERWIILTKGKLHFPATNLKHIGNWLVKIVADWQLHFSEDLKKLETDDKTDITSN